MDLNLFNILLFIKILNLKINNNDNQVNLPLKYVITNQKKIQVF